MSLVVSLTIRPPARPTLPWTQVRWEEATVSSGPWTVIDTQALSPLDTDPTNPLTRFLETDNATVVNGWYRLTFIDAAADESNPTGAVQNSSELPALVPTVDEIGALLRARTKVRGTGGQEAGTFNDQTRPTANEVEDLINTATDTVLLKVGAIPDRLAGQARQVIKFLTAQLIELSYFPEQIGTDQSAYTQYNALYEELLGSLVAGVQDDQPGIQVPRFYSMPLVGENGYTPWHKKLPQNWPGLDALA